jgi:hypothetical protein
MKKQGTTDAKRAAANDREENGKTETAPKVPRPAEHLKLGDVSKVKRGFLKAVVDLTKKKGTVDAAMLFADFAGRQIDGKKITTGRVHRYIGYCKAHGIFVKANGPMKFQPGQIVATPGVLEAFRASGESPLTFLQRHLAGDWETLTRGHP